MATYFVNDGNAVRAEYINELKMVNKIKYVYTNTEQKAICHGYDPPVADFIGRCEELSFLKRVTVNGENEPRIIVVVSGLGGVGKTQLVKKFIEENRDFYRNVIWINSQERGLIEDEFKILARDKLKISIKNGETEIDFRTLIEELFSMLTKSPTLIVFDNVDEIENTEIVLRIGTLGVKPHIVITSRIQEWSDSICLLKLGVFTSEDALDYVSIKLKSADDNDTLDEKKALVKTLQSLPIALRQATAHIRHQRKQETYEISNYITEYNSQREDILASKLFQRDILHQYTETTLTTWEVTLNAINKCGAESDLAHRILCIISYFDSVRIRRDIFFNLNDSLTGLKLDPSKIRAAVRLLINYSMVDSYERQSVLSIHRLVQEVIKIKLDKVSSSEEQTLREGLQLITEMIEDENFQSCHEHGISAFLSALKFNELVNEFDVFPLMILQSLNEFAKYNRAVSFGTQILQRLTTIFGEDHQYIRIGKYEIAESYRHLDKHSEALEIYQEALAKEVASLAADHQHMLLIESRIAESLRGMGKYSEALQLFQEILKKQNTISEEEDSPDTLNTKFQIAKSYRLLGKESEALQMFQQVLEKEKTILGGDHPHILVTKSELAQSYNNLGKHSEALQMFEDVLEKQQTTLVEDHPHTLISKKKIADSYRNLGNNSDALRIYQEVLDKENIKSGDDHADTLVHKFGIAQLYGNLGKNSDALQMFEEILEEQKAVLGGDHPHTLFSKFGIADSYSSLGQHFDALQIYQEFLEERKTVLEEDHPDILYIKFRIANSYSNLASFSEALQLYQEILEKQINKLGGEHPDTVTSQLGIAESYSHLDKHLEALQTYQEVMETLKKTLGENHPDTFVIKLGIAESYNHLGQHSEALRFYEEALHLLNITLGEDHPNILVIKYKIADCYSNLDQHSVALRIYQEILEEETTALGPDHPATFNVKSKIADSYKNLGKQSEALRIYQEIFENRKLAMGEDHPETLEFKSKIDSCSKRCIIM